MAMTKWGRKETIIWPPHGPIYTYGAVFMAVVLTGLFLYCRFTFGNSPLQRFYTPTYIRSSVAGAIGASRRDNYRMLMVGARGIHTATGDERRRDRRQRRRNRAANLSRLRSRNSPCGAAMLSFTWDRSRAISTRP